MEDSKKLPSENSRLPEIVTLKRLQQLNIIYVLFILYGNRSKAAPALGISLRGLRLQIKSITAETGVLFPDQGPLYRMQYLKMNHPNEVSDKWFIQKQNPSQIIENLKVYVSEFGFPYREILSEQNH